MNWQDTPLLLALIVDLFLGLVVFLTNRGRTANRLYLLVCLVIALWMCSVLMGLNSVTTDDAEFWIRCACASSTFIPSAFYLLRLSIILSHPSLRDLFRAARWPLLATGAVAVICFLPVFMKGVTFPAPDATGRSVAEPAYGPGFPIFGIYYISYLGTLVWLFTRDIRRSLGMARVELQFIALGAAAMMTTGVTLAIVIPALVGNSSTAPYGPLSVLFLTGFVAYGIATHRIMEVSHVLRRLTAYNLLAVYLVVVYVAVFYIFEHVLMLYEVAAHSMVAHTLAALVVAFSMAPASTRFQDLARRLFVNVHGFDFGETVQRANRMLASIRTLPELTRQFSGLLSQSFGTDRVFLYLLEGDHLRLRHASGTPAPPDILERSDPLLGLVAANRDPIVRDILNRMPPTPALRAGARRLAEWEASVAVGIYAKDRLGGVLLLGPRLTGRIYGIQEQTAIRALCDQFAVAQDNARLYTEVQDAKNYNERLLEKLVSGVLAVDAAQRVTVFNLEAQRITRLDASAVLGRTPEPLPESFRQLVSLTFASGEVPRDTEISWRVGGPTGPGETVTVRVSGTRLSDHAGHAAGALLVFHDVSTLKKLEEQVRRTDRLASLGTLSAGMAHEIKNPLVTLKTFVQLLPERYEDPEFRTTFASLLGDEVMRIDRLVNQLLRFARPTKPSLAPLHLHQVADHVLRLVGEQARQKNIACVSGLRAQQDSILGDHDLLVQALLNLLFNAMEAMGRDGSLMVTSELIDQETSQLGLWGGQPATEPYIRLTVRDTGPGIRPEDVAHVFDPFFTTKSSGTGLGLSVAHGIIQEHNALIDVESVVGQGTAFHLLFPIAAREARV